MNFGERWIPGLWISGSPIESKKISNKTSLIQNTKLCNYINCNTITHNTITWTISPSLLWGRRTCWLKSRSYKMIWEACRSHPIMQGSTKMETSAGSVVRCSIWVTQGFIYQRSIRFRKNKSVGSQAPGDGKITGCTKDSPMTNGWLSN